MLCCCCCCFLGLHHSDHKLPRGHFLCLFLSIGPFFLTAALFNFPIFSFTMGNTESSQADHEYMVKFRKEIANGVSDFLSCFDTF